MSDFNLDKFIKERKEEIAERENKSFEEVVKDILIIASEDLSLPIKNRMEAKRILPWAKKEARAARAGLKE